MWGHLQIRMMTTGGQGMVRSGMERRRGRRVDLGAPLLVRRLGAREPGTFKELVAQNISLAGVYFETDEEEGFPLNEVFIASVSIPEPHRRAFPFTRLAGPSRVVRVIALPQQVSGEKKRFGVALEFGRDITALTATPPRG